MRFFRPTSTRQQSIGLAVLRVVTGVIFVAHGWQKLFVLGLPAVTSGFAQMGVPMPAFMGPFIGGLELFGGLALVFGLLTRLTALALAFDMLGAIFLVHIKSGFFLPRGAEFEIALLGATVALVFTGAGAYSLDGLVNAVDKADKAESAVIRPEPTNRRAA